MTELVKNCHVLYRERKEQDYQGLKDVKEEETFIKIDLHLGTLR